MEVIYLLEEMSTSSPKISATKKDASASFFRHLISMYL